MKLAFADVYRYVAEPSAMEVTAEQMLDDGLPGRLARLIDMQKGAQDFKAGNPVKGGTIYLTAADENGMMVSFIQSNYMGFGSGCVEPTLASACKTAGAASAWTTTSPNLVAPGKRPFHTIIPAFLTKDGQPVMSYGVMGANMQPQGHMQTLVRMLDYGQNPQDGLRRTALALQRRAWRSMWSQPWTATVQGLIARGHSSK
jgi:gamma-glutamyltranspeptidase/glutathione hydrolase